MNIELNSVGLISCAVEDSDIILSDDVFQNVDLPETMSMEMMTLLEGLLQRDVEDRLGCLGNG